MKDYLIYKNQIEKIISNVEAQVCVSFYDLDLKKSFSINGDKKSSFCKSYKNFNNGNSNEKY